MYILDILKERSIFLKVYLSK